MSSPVIYSSEPYIGRILVDITPTSVIIPAYINKLGIYKGENLDSKPYFGTNYTSLGVISLNYDHVLIPGDGSLYFSGMAMGLTTLAMQENADNIFNAVTGENISTITLTPQSGSISSAVSYKDCVCTSSDVNMRTVGSDIWIIGALTYMFSYIG